MREDAAMKLTRCPETSLQEENSTMKMFDVENTLWLNVLFEW